MLGSTILDTAIGLLFVYLLLSLICSTVTELIEAVLKNRAKDLELGIYDLFEETPQNSNYKREDIPQNSNYARKASQSDSGDKCIEEQVSLAESIFRHPLINGLYTGSYKGFSRGLSWMQWLFLDTKPSYIPSETFARALWDIVTNEDKSTHNIEVPKGDSQNNPQNPTQPAPAPPAAPAPNTFPIPGSGVLPSGLGAMLNNAMFGTAGVGLPGSLPAGFGPAQPLAKELESINKLKNKQASKAIRSLFDGPTTTVATIQKNIEKWYNNSTDRISGRYKRRSQVIILLLSSVMTVLLNVNTITITNHLMQDRVARESMLKQVQSVLDRSSSNSNAAPGGAGGANANASGAAAQVKQPPTLDEVRPKIPAIESLSVPLGWSNLKFQKPEPNFESWWKLVFSHLVGWFITAIAVSLGAPFWFDILNRFIVVRSTIKPQEKSGMQPSKESPAPDTEGIKKKG